MVKKTRITVHMLHPHNLSICHCRFLLPYFNLSRRSRKCSGKVLSLTSLLLVLHDARCPYLDNAYRFPRKYECELLFF